MSTRSLLDPEVAPVVDLYPAINLNHEAVRQIREQERQEVVLGDPSAFAVRREELQIPPLNAGDPAIRCLKYSPEHLAEAVPGYLHMHGGGYLWGLPESLDMLNLLLASSLQLVVISVDYRLAPEHPVPAGLDDSYAALAWIHENAEELHVDRERIAIGGESAGGGMAAALAQKALVLGDYAICHQHLTYPMLDNRTGSPDQPGDAVTGEFIWTRERNQFAWNCYLGSAMAEAPHVPARAADLAGLPSTWLSTADLDLFREENIAYAQALMAARVRCELVVYPGTCHAFQAMRDAAVTRRFVRDHMEALGRALDSPPAAA